MKSNKKDVVQRLSSRAFRRQQRLRQSFYMESVTAGLDRLIERFDTE